MTGTTSNNYLVAIFYIFLLPVAHRSRNTLNGGWGGGGGGGIQPQVSLKNGFLINVYCLETPKFVVTTNWL